jgi:mono/diheme cytochrome c family protein
MRLLPLAVALLGSGSIGGCGGNAFPEPPVGRLSSPDAIRSGEAIYEKNCSICHGPSGHGDGPQSRSLSPPPSDLRNLTGERANRGYWFLRIERGGKDGPLPRDRSAMPAWGDHLSDDQIWDLVAYLNSISGGST